MAKFGGGGAEIGGKNELGGDFGVKNGECGKEKWGFWGQKWGI